MNMPIKVALADDHPMVIDGLSNALSIHEEIEVAGIYKTGRELLTGIRHNLPDILLLDLQLPDKTGQELAIELLRSYPTLRILILSGVESPGIIQDMMKEGCCGYLLKNTTDKHTLLKAIFAVYEGRLFLEPVLKERLLESVLRKTPQPVSKSKKLTAREMDVLRLIAMEYTNQQIADRLFISLRTVESHRHNLIQKLEVKNAIGLIKAAMDLGLMN